MVKGVNKTIIEVNNTGSKVFDKIVFYVSPSCSNLSSKNLNRAIRNFTFLQDEKVYKPCKSLRQQRIIRRRVFVAGAAGIVLALATIVTLLIF